MKAVILLAVAVSSSILLAQKPKLSIIWHELPACDGLKQQAALYPDADTTVNCVPFGQWYDRIFSDFAAKRGADVVILDSQWIGEAVKENHIVELTAWMRANIKVDDYVPAALSAYGEYPQGSGRYYGLAANADAQMLIYRKDAFAKLGFDPPKSWSELLRQAQAFKTRTDDGVDNGFVTHWCGTRDCYDALQTAWNEIAWSFGGELWDPGTFQVDGILNAQENITATQFAADLLKTGPSGAEKFQFQEVIDSVCSGSSAMATIWFAFGTSFTDPRSCRQAENLGFAVVPGEKEHFISLGGQGMHISSYTANRDAALAFLRWFQSDEQQLEWVRRGGVSARRSILASELFQKSQPFHPAFTESYGLVKDFWNIPEYADMLPVQGEQLSLAITGQLDAKAALDRIARDQQQILDRAYPNRPPAVPQILPQGIVNAASFLSGAAAPGELVTIFGTGIGPVPLVTASFSSTGLGTVLSKTRVLFDGVAAPVIYAGTQQVSAIVPYGAAGKTNADVQVEFLGRRTNATRLVIAGAAPGIFTLNSSGRGQAAAFNQNLTVNGSLNPAAKGSVVVVYATGAGQMQPSAVDGALGSEIIGRPVLPVTASVGGIAADVLNAGVARGLPSGILRVEIRVPPNAPAGGAVPLMLTVGSVASQSGVTIAIQ